MRAWMGQGKKPHSHTHTHTHIRAAFLPWRTLPKEAFAHVSVLCPTRRFMELLPRRSLPST